MGRLWREMGRAFSPCFFVWLISWGYAPGWYGARLWRFCWGYLTNMASPCCGAKRYGVSGLFEDWRGDCYNQSLWIRFVDFEFVMIWRGVW